MLRYVYFGVFALLNIFVIVRTLEWFKNCKGFFELKRFKVPYVIVMGLMSAFIIVSFYLQESGHFHWVMKFSNQWFGILFYIIFYVVMADIVWFIIKVIKKEPKDEAVRSRLVFRGGLVVIVLIIATSIYGFVHLRNMKTTNYEVTIDKKVEGLENMRVVLVADQHLGYNIGASDMEKMVEKINEAKPDLVCFAGDIFDNNFKALDDVERIGAAFASIESTYGVYACWGNHDVDEPLFSGFSVDSSSEAFRDPQMGEFLEAAGFILLEDKEMLVNDMFYVIGRLDYKKPGDGTKYRETIEALTKDINKDKPIILLDHQPREFDEISAAGVDLDLSGHTHAGQMFPMNLTNELTWENGYGMKKIDDLTSIVTSGVGVFGPAMRTFTDSEVVIIDIAFQN